MSVLMTDSLMLIAAFRKIKANTATGRDEEKTLAKCAVLPELVMGAIMHYLV